MRHIKPFALAILCSAFASSALADAAMVDLKQKMYDADYEATVADYGYVVGTAVYGAHDADYDVLLSDASLFKPLLGHYDADYEAVLKPAAYFQSAEVLQDAGTQVASR
ncbi:MAG: hypothetical protein AAF230_02075 [Pseudomonadota bacterium]